jgi:hypothetical protein
MLSYDYNHFETILNVPDDATLHDVNERRKDATRLCLEAIRQYQSVKNRTAEAENSRWRAEEIAGEAELAMKTPESERTPEQKAIIKADADLDFAFQHGWVDFDDDPEEYCS